MSSGTVRIIVAVVLMAHGLGHALPVFPLLGRPLSQNHSTDSWLLTGMIGKGPSGAACALFSLWALAAFIEAGLGLAAWSLPRESWERWAVTGALVSLSALVVFWNALPFLFPNKIGVIVVDLYVLLSVFWLRWPEGVFNV